MSIKARCFPPEKDADMFTIKAIGYRKILNSHVEFTNEYRLIVEVFG